MSGYEDFVERKTRTTEATGFDPRELAPHLYPFQADLVRWALRRGKAALFADTGLGKTAMQIEWARQVSDRIIARADRVGRVLILAPLAVAKQTKREAARFGVEVHYCRELSDVKDGVNVTNYDRLEKFAEVKWDGVVLDESSILKSFDGRTRTAIIDTFERTPFKLACTATPSPNDHTELGNHAEFLGAMTRSEMLAMFFFHDGGETQNWTLKGHARAEFWRWVASWACVVKRPSDVDPTYDDAAFALPELRIHSHVVPADADTAKAAGKLFVEPAVGLTEQRIARRSSISARAKLTAEIVNASPEPWLIWCDLNDEADAVVGAIDGARQVRGSDDDTTKEIRLFGFVDGDPRVLVTKPKIAGFGMNWQHASKMAFCGVSHSFEAFYQCIRREWRFGQKSAVDVHVITGELEGNVVDNLNRKQAQAEEMQSEMAGFTRKAMRIELRRAPKVERPIVSAEVRSGDGWTVYHGDCVDVTRALAPDSVDYTIFSPPFASLYTYSDSPRDMGNCTTHDQFYEHFSFLVPEMLRVTKPGRLLSFHCMNIPTSKSRDGFIGLSDFRGILIKAFQSAGWIYHSEVVIWKDPVTAMQRTKALGLLHKTIRKDSSMSRQGIPDYLVTMRKPGANVEPIAHTPEEFPVDLWQRYASPVWMDINPSDTLQGRSARENEDEKHICPLQLEVIRRAMLLWTNPGDLVLSPFTGIGSEGYVALSEGRSFVGAELKGSYFRQACANLESVAVGTKKQIGLFGEAEATT